MNEIWKNKDLNDIYGEYWKDIFGYEGYYMISNMGRVKSLDRIITYSNGRKNNTKGVIIGQILSGWNKNYLCVHLNKNGKRKPFNVHRLMAIHFLDGFNEKLQVNHIDRNTKNNKIENLEMVTAKENMSNVDKSLFNGKIKCVAEKDGEIIEFPTAAACARHIGCHPESVRRMLKCIKPYRLNGWEIKILKTL